MKISGKVIQNRNITINTSNDFLARYKGKEIFITTNHGFGKPEYKHLKRFVIDVQDVKTGSYDVDALQDFHTIHDAIRYALDGACLLTANVG